MNEEMTKVVEVYVHNGKEDRDDVVTCNFLEGATDHITPIILSSMCVAMIEKVISSVPEESQVELEENILALLFYMLKKRYDLFDIESK